MNVDLNKIKARIRALSAKTVENGCTEAEAIAAIAVVGKLLQEYNLSMDVVDIRDEPCDTHTISTGSKHRGGVYYAVASIAAFTGCKIWSHRSSITGLNYVFFGQESDLLMARYLYDLIDVSIEAETVRFKSSDEYNQSFSKRGSSSSFAIGMGSRISRRLLDLKQQSETEVSAARGGNNALVILKNQVVTDAFAKLNLQTKKSNSNTSIKDSGAFKAGMSAGEKVNLSRPVNGPSNPVYRIAN